MALSYKSRYCIYGAVFGCFFPLFSLPIALYFSHDIWILYSVICTAPLFLGWVAMMVGSRQDKLNRINSMLEKMVRERTIQIKSMLDVIGQGFLSFGQDLKVRENYSKHCEELFGRNPLGIRLPELLFSDESKREEFTSGFALLFARQTKPYVIFKLMEKEAVLNDNIVELSYRMIDENEVLCILTDKTLQVALENKEKQEVKERNIIYQVLSHQQYFSSFVKDTDSIFGSFDMNKEWSRADYANFQRSVHTLKGNASFLFFESTAAAAHTLEDYIGSSLANNNKICMNEQMEDIKTAYNEELEIIRKLFGDNWLAVFDRVSIPIEAYRKLESRYAEQYGENDEIYRTIRNFRKVPLQEMLAPLPAMSRRIALALSKGVEALEIRGDNIQVLPEYYQPLVNSFVHIIRNMVDHGIELPTERKKLSKAEKGQININIEQNSTDIIFSFSDDGRGVSVEEIVETGRSKGLLSDEDTIDNPYMLLFRREFTTAKEVTEISGRGMGLWSVKAEVDRLSGNIHFESAPGRGTVMKIQVPLLPMNED